MTWVHEILKILLCTFLLRKCTDNWLKSMKMRKKDLNFETSWILKRVRMAQNSGCWISFVHYARENTGSKGEMVEICIILGRNAQISWNSWLTFLPLVRKVFQVCNFMALLLQKTKQKVLYLFQLMSGLEQSRCTIKEINSCP